MLSLGQCVRYTVQTERSLWLIPNAFTAHANTDTRHERGKWERKKMRGGNEGYKDGEGGWGGVIL